MQNEAESLYTDPSCLFGLMKKYVRIKCKSNLKNSNDNCVFGWVYTIDPITSSYVLVNFIDKKPFEVTIIMGDEVEEVQVKNNINEKIDLIEIEMHLENLFSDLNAKESHKDLEQRKNDLVDWLRKNRLPVKLETHDSISVINILDTVFIKPPYRQDSCESTNEIILDKVRNLVSNLQHQNHQ